MFRIQKSLLVQLTVLFQIAVSDMSLDNQRSSTFEMIHNPGEEMTELVQKPFHLCSIDAKCNFVVKDIIKNTFYICKNESEVPQNKTNLIIWKRKRRYSCLDWRYDSAMVNGIYRISDDDGVEFKVYCDFISEPNSVWTLIESFSLGKNELFKDKPFNIDFPYMEDFPNRDNYRLSKTRIEKIKSRSTHWRATCSFDVFGVDYQDYIRFKFSAFDPLCCYVNGSPKLVELVNVRGYSATEQLVDFWQREGEHLHLDSNLGVHFQQARNGSIYSEDNFGLYLFRNEAFRCTANSSSTTQHWIGIKYP